MLTAPVRGLAALILNGWARHKCHGNALVCCQYTDLPSCNSPRDTHLIGKLVWLNHQRIERWSDR